MYRVVDLFAGCGGLSQGFADAGYEVVGAIENWAPAIKCYQANFAHPVVAQDLSDVSRSVQIIRGWSPDIIIGGPPCQDFSSAGRRIEADRASLTESFAQIIAQIAPPYFVMENVARAAKSKAFQAAERCFREAGYGLTKRVLTASYCGVPQRRKRFFCVGVKGAEDGFLDPVIDELLSPKETTVRDYLGDQLDTEFYYRHPRNYSRRAIFSIDEPAPTMRGVNRPIPAGYPGHPGDACKVGDGVRPLTTLERSLIQTFPADFQWVGSKTDCEQMIGNAVPVKLGAFVGTCLARYLESGLTFEVAVDVGGFRDYLGSLDLGARAVSDTISRLRRAFSLCPFDATIAPEPYFLELGASEKFEGLSNPVKSQLRGAVKKYCEYLASA